MKAILFLILVMPLLINGQRLAIIVVDDQGKPLPYSSVTWNKDLGLVTDSSGNVGIPDISLIDSLVVQSLGYEQTVFYRSSFMPLLLSSTTSSRIKLFTSPLSLNQVFYLPRNPSLALIR